MRAPLLLVGAWLLACSGSFGETPAPLPVPARDVPPPTITPTPSPRRPTNLLVLIADDLGTDKIAAYRESPTAPRTPAIDGLAAEGILFRNAYVYPTCSASRAALLTGRYGRRNGMGGIVDLDGSAWELPLEEQLIPEVLKASGKIESAAAVGKWHLSGFRTPNHFRHPLLQGFDHHVGALGNLGFTSTGYGQRANYQHFEKSVDGAPIWRDAYVTVDTADDAIRQIASLTEPWFVWVAFNAPHEPFHSPPANVTSGARISPDATDAEKYTAMVEVLDAQIGRVLASMTPAQRASTMVLFVGDNGTPKETVTPPFEPTHGKGSLYEGGTGVPWIVAGAGVRGRGVESAALVHAVDLLPTVAELWGADTKDLVLDGVSFAAQLSDPNQKGARRFVYTERFAPIGAGPYDIDMLAVRDERYKVMRTRKGDLQFYDLQGRNDDGPATPAADVVGEQRARLTALEAELERIERTVRFLY